MILFVNFPVIPASIVYEISCIFRVFPYRLSIEGSSGMSRVCVDSHSYSRNICTLGMAIDTASRVNTCAGKRRSGCFFWSSVSVQSAEYEGKHGEERKEISTFKPRRPELSFGISRRWDVAAPGEGSLREDRPASLFAVSVLHFCCPSPLFVPRSWANFNDFSRQSSVIVILQSSDSWLVSLIDLRINWGAKDSWLGNYRNKKPKSLWL